MTASTLTADRRSVVRASLAVGAATGAYGVAFGAAGTAAGLDVWQTCALNFAWLKDENAGTWRALPARKR